MLCIAGDFFVSFSSFCDILMCVIVLFVKEISLEQTDKQK